MAYTDFYSNICLFPSDVYVFQNIVECEYSKEDLSDMVYIIKLVFNQKLMCSYDSRLGKYVGYDEYGIKNADHYNSQIWKMKERKEELETVCRANARYYIKSTTRKGKQCIFHSSSASSFKQNRHFKVLKNESNEIV